MIPPFIPLASDTPRLRQHVSRSPMARRHANALPTKAAQIRMATRHHEPNSPHITRYRQSSGSPATRRVYISMFRAPLWHGAAQSHFPPRPRKSAWHCDITNVFRHTVCPHTRSNHITLEVNTSESSSATLFPVHLHYNWPLLRPAPKSSFPYYI